MNNKKIIEIPIAPHLYAFAKKFTENNVLNIPLDYPIPSHRQILAVHHYFHLAKQQNYPLLKFEVYSINDKMQYGLVRTLNTLFFHWFYLFVETHTKCNYPNNVAIQLFLNQFHIKEEDYKFETLVKKFYRWRKTKNKPLFID
jgi:hypothetical protein